MPVTVDKDVCVGCGACAEQCPASAIQVGADGYAACDGDVCLDCGACIDTCPVGAISAE